MRALGVATKQTVALHVWRRTSAAAGAQKQAPTLDIVLAAWRALAARSQRDKRLVQSAARILARQGKGKVFRAWAAAAREGTRQRRLVAQMLMRRGRFAAAVVVREWRAEARTLRRQRALQEDTVKEFSRKSPAVRALL